MRLLDHSVLCLAPQYIAVDLLRAEGFTDVRFVSPPRGKRVAVTELRGDEQNFTSMFVAHVGLDPRRDIEWIVRPFTDMPALLANGTIDAFFVGPPLSFDVRERKVGRVLVNTTTDKPWSQDFCCLLAARRDFYALRLHEAGLIRGNPQKPIAQSVDWRHYRELRG